MALTRLLVSEQTDAECQDSGAAVEGLSTRRAPLLCARPAVEPDARGWSLPYQHCPRYSFCPNVSLQSQEPGPGRRRQPERPRGGLRGREKLSSPSHPAGTSGLSHCPLPGGRTRPGSGKDTAHVLQGFTGCLRPAPPQLNTLLSCWLRGICCA